MAGANGSCLPSAPARIVVPAGPLCLAAVAPRGCETMTGSIPPEGDDRERAQRAVLQAWREQLDRIHAALERADLSTAREAFEDLGHGLAPARPLEEVWRPLRSAADGAAFQASLLSGYLEARAEMGAEPSAEERRRAGAAIEAAARLPLLAREWLCAAQAVQADPSAGVWEAQAGLTKAWAATTAAVGWLRVHAGTSRQEAAQVQEDALSEDPPLVWDGMRVTLGSVSVELPEGEAAILLAVPQPGEPALQGGDELKARSGKPPGVARKLYNRLAERLEQAFERPCLRTDPQGSYQLLLPLRDSRQRKPQQ